MFSTVHVDIKVQVVNDSIAFFISLKSRFTVKLEKNDKKISRQIAPVLYCLAVFNFDFTRKIVEKIYLAISRRTSPVNVLPAIKTLFPASTNSVIPSTFNDPPNSSTVGENRTK